MKQVTIIALVAIAFGSTLAANYCGIGKCAQCFYIPILAEDRSCTMCIDGRVVAVGGNVLATKCDNEGKPANCAMLAGSDSVSSAAKECVACNEGFNFIKSSKSCAEQAVKIENGAAYEDGILTGCKKGYYQDSLISCVKATEIKDCAGSYYKSGSDILCSKCNKGFVPNTDGKSCIADVKNGCFDTTVPCTMCNVGRGYWAVDFDLAKGSICEWSAKAITTGAVFAFLFALLR
jgi:hypothetical protein